MKKKGSIIKELKNLLASFQGSSNSLVGLNIEPATIAALELSKGKKGPKIERIAIHPLTPNLVVNDDIQDIEAVTAAIKDCKQTSKLSNNAILAAPGAMVATKKVAMNISLLSNEQQQEEFAKAEAKKAFPAPLDELYLDFVVLDKQANDETSKRTMLLVAARKQDLQSRLDVYQQSGFEIKAIDVDYYALERAYQIFNKDNETESNPKTPAEHTAIINMNTSSMQLLIMQGNSMVYCHRQGYNGSSLAAIVQTYFTLSSNETRDKNEPIYNYHVSLGADNQESILNDEQKELLTSQTKRLLQFYYSASQHANITKLVLCGRCAVIPNITEVIETSLNLPTSLANPFENIELAKHLDRQAIERIAPGFAICFGLASHQLN